MATQFDIDAQPAPNDRGGGGKRYHSTATDGVDEGPIPVGGWYVLRGGTSVSIDPVTGRDAVFELISKTYTAGMLSDTSATSTNFGHCREIATAGSISYLTRPKDVQRLPDIVATVLAAIPDE